MRRLLLCLAIATSSALLTGCDEVFYTGSGSYYGSSYEPEHYDHGQRRHHRRDYGYRNHHVSRHPPRRYDCY